MLQPMGRQRGEAREVVMSRSARSGQSAASPGRAVMRAVLLVRRRYRDERRGEYSQLSAAAARSPPPPARSRCSAPARPVS